MISKNDGLAENVSLEYAVNLIPESERKAALTPMYKEGTAKAWEELTLDLEEENNPIVDFFNRECALLGEDDCFSNDEINMLQSEAREMELQEYGYCIADVEQEESVFWTSVEAGVINVDINHMEEISRKAERTEYGYCITEVEQEEYDLIDEYIRAGGSYTELEMMADTLPSYCVLKSHEGCFGEFVNGGYDRKLQSKKFVKKRGKKIPKIKRREKFHIEKPIFIEEDDTFAKYKGKIYILFEGHLDILEMIKHIDEIYDAQGKVIKHSTYATYIIAYKLGEQEELRELSLQSFNNGGFISEMSFGCSSLAEGSDEKKLFREFVKAKCKKGNYKTRVVYSTGGWKKKSIKNDEWFYLTPKGVIGNASVDIKADSDKSFLTYSVYDRRDIITKFLNMRNILKGNRSAAVIFQYYLMLALLKSLLRESGVPMQFLLYICGETNSKKTSLAQIFFKTMNRDEKVDIDFTSTEVALLEAMEENPDAVTIFDDIVPAANKTAEKDLMKKLELLVRGYGGNVPRKVSKRFVQMTPGTSQYAPVLSQGVVTGEVFPVILTSSKTRVVKVDIRKNDCDEKVLLWYQQNLETLPTFVEDFLYFVAKNQKDLMKMAFTLFSKARVEHHLNVNVARFNETYANFLVGAEIFKAYLLDARYMSEMEVQQIVENDLAAISAVIHMNDLEASDQPNEELIASFLYSTLVAQKNSSEPVEIEDRVDEYEDFIVVTQPKLPIMLKKFYGKFGKVLPYYSTIDLSKFLASKGMILVKEESGQKRYAHKLPQLHGSKSRYYCFYKKKIEEIIEK